MAVKLTSDIQFFEKVFGASHSIVNVVKALIASGVKIEISLFTCKATFQSKTFQISLTQGSTALMKGVIEPVLVDQNKKIIAEWITKVVAVVKTSSQPTKFVESPAVTTPSFQPTSGTSFATHTVGSATTEAIEDTGWQGADVSVILTGVNPDVNLITFIKALKDVTGGELGVAKQIAEKVIAGKTITLAQKFTTVAAWQAVKQLTKVGVLAHTEGLKPELGAPVVAPTLEVKTVKIKPVPQVIPLRDAKAIGQKVNGTSHGSVYYCVALNERVRLAARILPAGSISIRAEWQGAKQEELAKLKEAGLQMKQNYASMHLNAENVPYGRVIGAFVLGVGIPWDQAVLSSTDLVVE